MLPRQAIFHEGQSGKDICTATVSLWHCYQTLVIPGQNVCFAAYSVNQRPCDSA